MASKVQIANRALTRLGRSRITAFSDNTDSAKLIDAIYEDVAEDVMSMGQWPSVVNRATLAQVATNPNHGYDHQYQLPTDPKCLRVLTLDEAKPGDNHYSIEGDKLLTDLDTVKIRQ